jgi:HK97 family phage major capsid protein
MTTRRTREDCALPEPTLPREQAGVLYREFTVRVERAADAPDDAPLSIAISSEAAVERRDWLTGERYLEVLDHSTSGPDLSYARDGLPFLLDHDLRTQIGRLTNVRVDADNLIRGELRAGNHPDASWAMADMRDGIRPKVSVGYDPGTQYTETKGARGTVPTRRYTGWRLFEASSVAVPADYGVGVGRSHSTVAADAARTEESRMSDTLDTATARDTAVAAPAPAQAPDTRAQELAQLVRLNADLLPDLGQRFADWIVDGTSVHTAREFVMDALRKRNPAPISGVTVGETREAQQPWDANGMDFFRSVVVAGRGGSVDVRLRAQNTLVGEDGGFAVPQPVVNMLLEATMTGGEILSRVTSRPVTAGNSYTETIVKEEARAAGSRNGGVRGYWLAEDGTYQESQAATRQIDLKLQKLGALVKITDEQAEDGPALVSFINEQVPEELRFVAEQAIWEGSGNGQPLGALVSGALVTQAIENSQTIVNTAGNIWVNAAKMYARMPSRMLAGAAWFINSELWSKILTATAGTSGGSHPMFTAPGQLAAFPNGAIYGRPIVPVEYASAEGTVGDFVFANFADYLLITKGGIRQSASMHVDFVRDRQVLKFTWRLNGAPRTRTPLVPLKGANSLSPYIALAARS